MALSKQAQIDADTALAALCDALATRQAGVKDTAGRYRQCRASASWGTWDGIKPDSGTVTAWVDEYVGPLGVGYIVSGEVEEAGAIYRRSIDVGPEGRSHEWRAIQEGL